MDVLTRLLCAWNAFGLGDGRAARLAKAAKKGKGSGGGGGGKRAAGGAGGGQPGEEDDDEEEAIEKLASETVVGAALASRGFTHIHHHHHHHHHHHPQPKLAPESREDRAETRLTRMLVALVDESLRFFHLLVLILLIALCTTTSIGATYVIGPLISLMYYAGKLLCMERKLVLECGKSWWQLQFASYCSLALLVLFQAPLLPTTCNSPIDEEAMSNLAAGSRPPHVLADDGVLGLTKLHVDAHPSAPAAQHSSKTFPLIFCFANRPAGPSIQAPVLSHARDQAVSKERGYRSCRQAELGCKREQVRLYNIARLAAWNHLSS